MICPTCSKPVASGRDRDERHCKCSISQAATRRIAAVASRAPVRVQLTACVDATGSTGPFTEGVAATCAGIYGPVAAKAAQLRCTVFKAGDQDYAEPVVLLAEDVAPAEALAVLRKIEYSGGGDAAETHLLNFRDVLRTMPVAGPGERAAFVALTTSDSKPLPDGQAPKALGEEFKARDIIVCVVGDDCPRLKEFVQGADGFYFQLSNTPSPDELARISAKVAASISASLSSGRKTTRLPAA